MQTTRRGTNYSQLLYMEPSKQHDGCLSAAKPSHCVTSTRANSAWPSILG